MISLRTKRGPSMVGYRTEEESVGGTLNSRLTIREAYRSLRVHGYFGATCGSADPVGKTDWARVLAVKLPLLLSVVKHWPELSTRVSRQPTGSQDFEARMALLER